MSKCFAQSTTQNCASNGFENYIGCNLKNCGSFFKAIRSDAGFVRTHFFKVHGPIFLRFAEAYVFAANGSVVAIHHFMLK